MFGNLFTKKVIQHSLYLASNFAVTFRHFRKEISNFIANFRTEFQKNTLASKIVVGAKEEI